MQTRDEFELAMEKAKLSPEERVLILIRYGYERPLPMPADLEFQERLNFLARKRAAETSAITKLATLKENSPC